MTDKALEAAARAIASETPLGKMDRAAHVAALAIEAFLSALSGEAEVVAWKHKLTSIIRYDRPNSYDLAQGDYEPLVTLASLQAMQARAEKAEEANKALMDERTNLIETKRQQIEALTSRAEAAERERDEAVDWTATVERHGADGFDDLAEAWLALPAIQRTTNAAISTFSKWANEDLMARFKKNQLAMFHLAFVEGCLAGVRTESVLSKTAEARVKELEEAFHVNVTDQELVRLNNMAVGTDEVTISSRMMLTLVGCIIAARTALKGGSNG